MGLRSKKRRNSSVNAKPQNAYSETIRASLWRRLQEGGFILLGALAIFLFVALFTYHEGDPGWSRTATAAQILNAAGSTGAFFSDLFFFLFGYVAYLFPILIGFAGIRLFQNRLKVEILSRMLWVLRSIGIILAVMSGCGLANLTFPRMMSDYAFSSGGILGDAVTQYIVITLGPLGSTLTLLAVFLTGITLATGLSWFGLMSVLLPALKALPKTWKRRRDEAALLALEKNKERDKERARDNDKGSFFQKKEKTVYPSYSKISKTSEFVKTPESAKAQDSVLTSDSVRASDAARVSEFAKSSEKSSEKPSEFAKMSAHENASILKAAEKNSGNILPSVDLLQKAETQTHPQAFSESKLEALSREVETRLLEFGLQVNVVGVQPGPVITRFELELAAGIKVSRISGLAKDLARALSVTRVRVVEVIPGKSVVGLEIPNAHRELVLLREIIESEQYQGASSPLSLALGKDISGKPEVVNLSKMPHLLVAGTTGSGKSVGVNAMLLSLLFKARPDEVRLILIDPKMLELSIYDGIPHLLTPVVTDMKDAATALRWCVAEMERRYQVMAAVGVRNLSGFNQKIQDSQEKNAPLGDPLWKPEKGGERPLLKTLPYIVVIIDEFADMMMVVGKKVEELIARIAQKARAAGIHLILATQRPSVDVITGLIKANIPTRIAFQVSSRIDSRTILDQQGAEQLLGHGDMLYLPPGTGIPTRIHGAFVSDEEVHAVVKMLKQLGEPDYGEDILGGDFSQVAGLTGLSGLGSASFGMEEGGEQDPFYDQAVNFVLETRRASISSLQRRLKVGYNRAARLIETMEAAGVVSAMQHNGSREVLAGTGIEE